LLLMSLEALGLNLATMVVALATGRMPARELVGYVVGLDVPARCWPRSAAC
jgi:hypothetical protein